MKIRELLQQKKRRFTYTAVAAAIIGVLAFQASFLLDVQWILAAGLIAFVVAGIAVFGSKYGVRCPRCNGNIGSGHNNFSARPLIARPLANCPFCGIRLDELAAA
ncbi:DNA-directed RNA polymerase subunit RPC12/RpoP [Pseudoxanthomonas japonensis]|uniref:hypothetical protein n=1 Tax=Pseudoxanthomonas japonensis TaxID=69284 RepID=UPI002865C3E4|nr:hypothetical protein [Pseudoxanthomonas japonensis]MDR7070854.1 DNA-directed RNA polymerase subunit RPC12/RpoP [Pseudoxanthomonas japonensis]